MKTIDYKKYFDKVFGCWLGKSIAGTIGAPFEGRKELFNYEYDKRSIEQMLPNDDLDIQVIWLEVLEKKGIYFTSNDLAQAFYEKYPFSPGEYAYFKKNYIRGIMPPVSGSFNNTYYFNGMGCPIRSEIWACVTPGNAELAKEFAEIDGVLDHGPNSVEGEIFLAALESLAFFESDIMTLIYKAMSYLNKSGEMYRLIENVLVWCEEYDDFKKVRALILQNFGHADCTNLYQNMGISLTALILGKGDFIKTTMMALNCGYDTDCTCATVGSVLGIIKGSEELFKLGFWDTGYVLDAKVTRRSNTLYDLAEDTCAAGITMAKYRNTGLVVTDAPDFAEIPHDKNNGLFLSIDYNGIPAMKPDETRVMRLKIFNDTSVLFSGELNCKMPDGWDIKYSKKISVLPFDTKETELIITAHSYNNEFHEKNDIVFSAVHNGEPILYSFGITGAAIWKVYGPFWKNRSDIPQINYWDKYDKYFDNVDALREYHLNTFEEINHEYVNESDFDNIENTAWDTCSLIPTEIGLYEDCFSLSEFVKYKGSCCVYMIRELVSDEEKTAVVNIGHSAPYKLWINGKLISKSEECVWWTAENKHTEEVKIKKGVNKIVLKAARVGQNDTFNIFFNDGLFSNHHYNYSSKVK